MRVPLKIAMLAALLVVVSASSSWALIEQFLPGGAGIEMTFTNWDEGTQYDPNMTVGQLYTRPGEPGYNAAYDLQTLRNSANTTLPVGGVGNEDTWGIFFLENVKTSAGKTLWSSEWLTGDVRLQGLSAFEVTMLFTGEHDMSLFLGANGVQTIKGKGLEFAFFEDTSRDFFNAINGVAGVPGPATRVDYDTFPTVTNANTGVLSQTDKPFWTGKSMPAGVGTNPHPYEFYAEYNPGDILNEFDDSGQGEFFAQAAGHSTLGVGYYNDLLADLGGDINFKFKFDADALNSDDWLLKSDDPVVAKITPELSTSWLMLLGMVPVGMAWRRRKRS